MMTEMMKLLICSSVLWILPFSISTIIDGGDISSIIVAPTTTTTILEREGAKTLFGVKERLVLPLGRINNASSPSDEENNLSSSSSSSLLQNSNNTSYDRQPTKKEKSFLSILPTDDELLSIQSSNNSTNSCTNNQLIEEETMTMKWYLFMDKKIKTVKELLMKGMDSILSKLMKLITNWQKEEQQKDQKGINGSSNKTYKFVLKEHYEKIVTNLSLLNNNNNIRNHSKDNPLNNVSNIMTYADKIKTTTTNLNVSYITNGITNNIMMTWNKFFFSNVLVNNHERDLITEEKKEETSLVECDRNENITTNESEIIAPSENTTDNSRFAVSLHEIVWNKLVEFWKIAGVYNESLTKKSLQSIREFYVPIADDVTLYLTEHKNFFMNFYYLCMAIYHIIKIGFFLHERKQQRALIKEEEEEEEGIIKSSNDKYYGKEYFDIGQQQVALGQHRDACKNFAKSNAVQRQFIRDHTLKLANLYRTQALKHCDDDIKKNNKYPAIVMLGISTLLKHRPLNPEHIQLAAEFQTGYGRKVYDDSSGYHKRDVSKNKFRLLQREIDRTLKEILQNAEHMSETIKAHAKSMKVVKKQRKERRRNFSSDERDKEEEEYSHAISNSLKVMKQQQHQQQQRRSRSNSLSSNSSNENQEEI